MIGYSLLKRTIDLLLSVLLIVATFPLQIIIAAVLFLDLRENPFFFQTRALTLNKFCFTMIKFRTISSRQAITKKHDHSNDIFLFPSLTRNISSFARWLRKTGLDELPQIYNVFIGQMSFVGPRPLMIQDLQLLEKQYPHYYKMRESITAKSGITGVWQIFGDRFKGVENLISLDRFYDENKSFRLDLKIMLLTIPVILFANNSDAIMPKINFMGKFKTE